MNTIVSYPDRGFGGKNSYRGNCSGRLIEDIIDQYHLKGLSDFMVGSGTTEDVVKARGLRGSFADLNRGYDMLTMDIPDRAEALFFHPPYASMIRFAGFQYSAKEVEKATGLSAEVIAANDLSAAKDWDDFIKKLNYCMLKQFAALEKGGRMFTLVGDWKQKGRLFSMVLDMVKPGTLEQVIIKAQHNCTSSRTAYSGNFVPIVHEYLVVTRKDSGLIIPVSFGTRTEKDVRTLTGQSWRDLVYAVVQENGGRMSLEELYDALKDSAKSRLNPHWREKIRQTVQNAKYFTRTERGAYAVA